MKNEKFKNVRLSKQMTILELAGRSGVSVSYVEKMDSGWVLPTYKIAEKVALVLECSVADIFPENQLKGGK